MKKPATGTISWTDLTVADADAVRAFYEAVVGWTSTPLDMGGYSDFVMAPPGSETPAGGICHARGLNAELPPLWLVYITVDNLDASMDQCRQLGGTVIADPRNAGPEGRFCVIRDPAGAVAALYEPARTEKM